MAVTVADLQATLRMDIAQFQSAVATASASADKLKASLQAPQAAAEKLGGTLNQATGWLNNLGLSFQKLAHIGIEPIAALSPTLGGMLTNIVDKASPATLAVTGLAGAAVGLGATLFGFARSAGSSAHEVELFADRTGFSTTAIQGLRTEAQLTGGTLEDLNTGIRSMQDFLGRAAQGEATASQLMRDLGLDIRDVVNLNPDDQFATMARAIEQLPPGIQRTTDGMGVFGRGFLALVPTMKAVAGPDGMQGIIDKGRELGTVLPEATVKAASAFDRWWNESSMKMKALATQIGAFLVSAPSTVSAPPGSILAGQFGAAGAGARPSGPLPGEIGGPGGPENQTPIGPVDSQLRALTVLQNATDSAVREMKLTQLQSIGDITAAENQRFENERQNLGKSLNANLEQIQSIGQSQKQSADLVKSAQNEAVAQFIAGEKELEAAHAANLEKIGEAAIPVAKAAIQALQPIDAESQRIRSVIGNLFGPGQFSTSGLDDVVDAMGKVAAGRKELEGLGAIKNLVDPENTKTLDAINTAMDQLLDKMRQAAQQAGLNLNLMLPGGVGGTNTAATQAQTQAQRDLATSVFQVGNAFFQTREAANQFAESIGQTTDAVTNITNKSVQLEDVLTGHSLDTSFANVGSAATGATGAVDQFTESMDSSLNSTSNYINGISVLTEKLQGLGTVTADLSGIISSGGGAPFGTLLKPGESGQATQALFNDIGLFPGSVGGFSGAGATTLGTGGTMSVSTSATEILAILNSRNQGRGLSPVYVDQLNKSLADIIAQQRAQSALERQLADMMTGGSARGAGAVALTPIINTTVNLNGLTMVQSQRSIQDLALTISGMTADAAKRQGLTG